MTPLGLFDSGYGGLTILKSIHDLMPQYDYVYLGDNARAPYGVKDYDTVYEYTLQAIRKLFEMGCPLVILACNTASAKALRTIQQTFIANEHPDKRVLGVIRPTAEIVGQFTRTGHVGIFATPGTINSESYNIEINHFYPQCKVTGLACPEWVPLVESGEYKTQEADVKIKRQIECLLSTDGDIDTIILGCTHYPFLYEKIRKYCPDNIQILSQGKYIADSLKNYLNRHTDIDNKLSRGSTCIYYTTDKADIISNRASVFLNNDITFKNIQL
ncbi:MAG: glutamate racemase [Bacteroidaceae bacterium]|nr:glutamate racemase [Bacteroidaceae bacterium]